MGRNRMAYAAFFVGVMLVWAGLSLPARAQARSDEAGTATQFIVTANGKGSKPAPLLQEKDISVQLNGRPATITDWTPLRGENAGLQLVFLFDESARSYLSLQIPSLQKFIGALPASAEVGVAYMANGRAVMAQTLTGDHALAAKSLRLTTGIPGISGSPYFCLSDLAKHWPSATKTRRVVLMVTNGEDPYYSGPYLQNPYLDAAVKDARKAGLMVYTIYFRNVGYSGSLSTLFGQNYLLEVSQGTGGASYANLMSSPVSFDPYLEQFKTSLENQYRLTVAAEGSGLQRVKVKSNVRDVRVVAPSAVLVGSSE